MRGRLYICPTPIGNLEDITLRVLRILQEVDLIAAEDTRHTMRLLNHYDIHKKLISYHEHNWKSAGQRIIGLLEEGKNIALVSDAGMPGISDPGEEIVASLIDGGYDFEVLPGPSAVINALVGSGMPTGSFMFLGFISREKKHMKEILNKHEDCDMPMVIYEAPHRIGKTLKFIHQIYGNRQLVICRELTKKFEEYYRTTIEDAILKYDENQPKGEMVVIIGPKDRSEDIPIEVTTDDMERVMAEADGSKSAVKALMEEFSLSKNDAYALVLEHKKKSAV